MQSSAVRRGTAGVVLLVLGAGLWLVYRLLAGTEPHSYADGVPPADVAVIAGHSYALAIRGGVTAEQQLGVSPANLRCTASAPRIGVRPLTVQPEASDTKAINQIASFVAPVSGHVHISCGGLPAVFVDDATDASGDHAGLALLLATIALTLGVPLALSALRSSLPARTRQHDQVERGVDSSSRDLEVGN
jgi:hypothetical protein